MAKNSINDLRKYMDEFKKKQLSNMQKIDSPYLQYPATNTGQWICALCKTVIRTEKSWNLHIKTNLHLELLNNLKKLEEGRCKRPLSSKPKDSDEKRPKLSPKVSEVNEVEKNDEEVSVTNQLPEGFFDNPKEDAKARNVVYQNPMDVEWQNFVKEIKEVDIQIEETENEETEEKFERNQFMENEQQFRLYTKIVELDKTKSEINELKRNTDSTKGNANVDKKNTSSSDSEDISESELDDEFWNWR